MFSRSCKNFQFFFVLASAFLGLSETVSACTCGPRPTVLDAYDHADVVIIGRAISVEKVPEDEDRQPVNGVRTTTFRVEKVFKGNVKFRDELVFGQGGGADCIWTFDEKSVGEEFLFYLINPDKYSDRSYLPSQDPRLWFAGGCGRSTTSEAATDDLLYLENIRKLRGRTRISGTIFGGWHNPDLNVEGKKVRIIGPKKTYQTKTDRHGVFEIYDLPPGKYLIEPETPSGWKIDPYELRYSPSVVRGEDEEAELKSPKQVAVMLEPKKHAGVDIVFAIDNLVRGKVIDPNGKPMHGVCVYLWTKEQKEGYGPFNCTDENGRFEIKSVPSGEYIAVANNSGKLSTREPFRTLYYPNVSEREQAAVITIGPGETVNDINIVVPRLEETITIEGVLRYSDGKPVVEKWVRFKAKSEDKSISGDVSEQTDSSGRFSLRVLKGLSGELSAEDWLMDGLYKNCPKVDELLAKSRRDNTQTEGSESGERRSYTTVTIQSNIINLEASQNFYNLELTLPFPRCEKSKEQ